MNEDVVLPLDALAEFARYVEAVNVEEERFAQARFVDRAQEILREAATPSGDPEFLAAKIPGGARAVRAGARRDRAARASGTCARSRCCGRCTARCRSSSAATRRSRSGSSTRTRRSATGSSSSRRTCTRATGTCT